MEKNNEWGKGGGSRSKDSGIECVHDISNIQIKVNTHDVMQHVYISISMWVYNWQKNTRIDVLILCVYDLRQPTGIQG